MLQSIAARFSINSRKRRGTILRDLIHLPPDSLILDLGGGNGEHINRIFPNHRNIVVCDISADDLKAARSRYGYQTVTLEEGSPLPFRDLQFDFVFCSSVIEHVTGPKTLVLEMEDDAEFKDFALRHQKKFADEVRRITVHYYVQTPNRYFPIESHSWLPVMIVFFKRKTQIAVLKFLARRKIWPKATEPDWNLLTRNDMSFLFPEAVITVEKFLGFSKSIMAIKYS